MVSEFPKYCESSFMVVAARPAMGRTRYVCALGAERAVTHPVLINTFVFSEKHLRARYNLHGGNIIIDDTPSPSVEELVEIIRKAVNTYNIKTAIIDYLNLLSGSNPDIVLSTLKSLAQELNIEIIAGVSVERTKFQRMVLAPTIEDIKMKGAEAIDVFIPLHNPDYYLQKTHHTDD